MERLNVYSSAPVSPAQAVAFLGLGRQKIQVVVRPLSEVPAALPPAQRPRSLSLLYDELEEVTVKLALLGDQLNEHEMGRCRLDAGVEQGLIFDREALKNRQKAILAALKPQKGELSRG